MAPRALMRKGRIDTLTRRELSVQLVRQRSAGDRPDAHHLRLCVPTDPVCRAQVLQAEAAHFHGSATATHSVGTEGGSVIPKSRRLYRRWFGYTAVTSVGTEVLSVIPKVVRLYRRWFG